MGVTQDGRDAIALRYFEPASDLRRYLSTYYLFRADLPMISDLMRADLAQVRFLLAGRGAYTFAGGRTIAPAAVSLVGPTMAATRFEAIGPVLVFGVGLLPAGWAAAVRDDACRYADRLVDAAALLGTAFTGTVESLREAPDAAAMVAIADAAFRALFAAVQEPPSWFTRMTDGWLTGAASPDVDTLVAASGLSARQVARLANRFYGARPKLLARKYRALRAASLLANQAPGWDAAAADAFYDQSHFIREVRHFTGLTPHQVRHDPPPLTRLSLGRRALAGKLPALALVS